MNPLSQAMDILKLCSWLHGTSPPPDRCCFPSTCWPGCFLPTQQRRPLESFWASRMYQNSTTLHHWYYHCTETSQNSTKTILTSGFGLNFGTHYPQRCCANVQDMKPLRRSMQRVGRWESRSRFSNPALDAKIWVWGGQWTSQNLGSHTFPKNQHTIITYQSIYS